jgi:hypothetical protein
MAQHEREMIAQPTSRTQLIMELSNHSAALVSNLPADHHMQLHTAVARVHRHAGGREDDNKPIRNREREHARCPVRQCREKPLCTRSAIRGG